MWEAEGRPGDGERPGEGDVIAQGTDGAHIARYASIGPYTSVTGDLEALSNWAGQGVGLVDRIQPAAEIVRELAEDAVRVLGKADRLIQDL